MDRDPKYEIENIFSRPSSLDEPDAPERSICMFHGFSHTKSRHYMDHLENWVLTKASEMDQPVTAYAFRFDAQAILDHRAVPHQGRGILRSVVWAFRLFLHRLCQETGEQDEYPTRGDYSIVSGPSTLSNKRITFIAHGLGAWIFKDVLAHPIMDSINLAYSVIDIKFLDVEVDRSTSDGYQKYLKGYWRTFGFGPRKQEKAVVPDYLVSYLQEVDENFAAFMDTDHAAAHRSAEDSPTPAVIYRDKDPNHRVWIPQDQYFQLSSNENEQIAGERRSFSRIFFSDQRYAPMIGKLPSSLDATESGTLYYPRDGDDESIVSLPDRDFIPSTCGLAKTFLQRGELENSAVLFEKVLAHTSSRNTSNLDMVRIRMQVAAVKIYRGYYRVAMRDLGEIKTQLERVEITDYDVNNLMYHCKRWMATCQLYAGRWSEAAFRMDDLLEGDPNRYHVRLHRDQALACAHLGQYNKARYWLALARERANTPKHVDPNQGKKLTIPSDAGSGSRDDGPHRDESPVDAKEERERRAKENSLIVAEARIDLLTGDYSTALEHSSDALNHMRRTVGGKHFRTLAIATLKAWSLAYHGKYNEAETLCSATWKATKAALGRDHPQTLEAFACLVYVYRCQGRYAEAIGTGMSATSISSHRDEDIQDHPEHIHVEFQLALSFLANGDYAQSRATFAKLVPRAETVMGADHPETLRYKAELARVLLSLGSITEAQDLASRVAFRQFQADDRIASQTTGIASTSVSGFCSEDPSSSNNHLSRLAELLDIALESPSSPKLLHPFLLSTLQLTAKIEIRKFQLSGSYKDEDGPHVDLAATQRILNSLQEYHHKREQLQTNIDSDTNYHRLSSASTAHDLATLLKEQPPPAHLAQEGAQESDLLPRATELYRYSYNTLKEALDENHLSTVLAQRDLTIAKTIGSSPDPQANSSYLQQVKTVSDSLYKKIESRLGVLHPEALVMRLWCFTIDLLLASIPGKAASSAENDWGEINRHLRDPSVVKQRLAESLVMRRQLAGLLSGTGKTEEALAVVGGALADIESYTGASSAGDTQPEGEEGLRQTLLGLRTSFEATRDECVSSTGDAIGEEPGFE